MLMSASHASELMRRVGFFSAPAAKEVEAPTPQRTAPPEEHEARRTLRDSGFYDPANPGLVHLQVHDAAVANLPKDNLGFPDWMLSLKNRSIEPRAGLAPGATMDVLDLDVIMKNTKQMPFVRFPHNSHTVWLDCSNCHPKLFEARAGANKIEMADIFRGKFCGTCHDRVAFVTFFSCHRCHSVPQSSVTVPVAALPEPTTSPEPAQAPVQLKPVKRASP